MEVHTERPRIISKLWGRRELAAARRAADRDLLYYPYVLPRDAWRAHELTTTKRRLALARSLRGTVRDADVRYVLGPSPINRGAVRRESERIVALAERLEALDRPVSARGVLRCEHLLVDSSGALYERERSAELAGELDRIANELESV